MKYTPENILQNINVGIRLCLFWTSYSWALCQEKKRWAPLSAVSTLRSLKLSRATCPRPTIVKRQEYWTARVDEASASVNINLMMGDGLVAFSLLPEKKCWLWIKWWQNPRLFMPLLLSLTASTLSKKMFLEHHLLPLNWVSVKS